MVVNRKQPVVPVPPISRTASSQPLPTKRQIRSSNATNAAPRDDQKSNGYKHTPSHPPRRTKALKWDKKQKSKTFTDYLILFLLSAFTCYSFYVCRPNPLFSSPPSEPQPSVCRALATYRTHVLEPYLLPPIRQTMHYAHKTAGVYVEEVQLRLSPYLEPAKITIDTITPHAKSFIRTTRSVWKNTVVSLYTQTLRPYYETAVVPRYTRYFKPHLVPLQNRVQKLFAHYVSSPVRSKTNFVLHKLHQFYTLRVDPYMRVARTYGYRFSNITTIYTAYLHPPLLKVWRVVQSTFCTTWKHFFRFSFRLIDGIYAYVKWVAREVGAYRRQYIDRHVDRILEQVADPKPNANAEETDSSPFIDSDAQETTTSETPESGSLSSPITASSSATPPTATTELGSSVSMPKVQATNNSGSVSPETSAPVPTPLESESALENAEHMSTVLGKEFDHLIDSDFIVTPTSSNTHSAHADEISPTIETVITEPTAGSTLDSDPDLDEFLRELGVESAKPVLNTVEDSNGYVVPSVRPKTEEERLAETAGKRADIVGRHEKWFEKLLAGVKETGNGLVGTLQSLRDAAAEEVKHLGVRPSKAESHKMDQESVRDSRSLVWVEQDGEKLIKGLEVYLRNAEGRCNDWKISKDAPDIEAKKLKHDIASQEKEKFSDIISKVEGKFAARVDDVRFQVHKWYVAVKEQEAEEVLHASRVIKDLASQAQEDLGMDYAWLDDVTYLDWQRYHDLMRVYDSFDITVRQIANGTSTDPAPPSDPVVEALDELDRDLQDIILGFNYALSEVRSHGIKVFNTRPLNGDGNDYDDGEGFFVVRDNEKRVVDLRGVDFGKVELKKEAVGVLPIKQDRDESDETVGILPVPDLQFPEPGVDTSKIIMGKDKVQIEEALRDIPPAQRHTEL